MADGGVALGLRIDGPWPGLLPGTGDGLPVVGVHDVGAGELDAAWGDPADATVAHGTDWPDGRPFLRVRHSPTRGYRIDATDHGAHVVAPDGSACRSALPADPALGARLIAAQVLPLLATLHGRVVLHAASVLVGGRVAALVAPAGTGKSTTLTQLLAAGAGFFGDDVLAVSVGGVAHAAPAALNVPRPAFADLDAAGRARLGRPAGASDKLHFELAPERASAPLGALVLLERDPAAASSSVTDVPADARALLGALYLTYAQSPARAAAQLGVLGSLSGGVRGARAVLGADGPAAAGRAVRAWIGDAA